MLNELHSLSNSLSAMGVSLEQWHQEYHTLPKMRTNAPCVRIWIDSDGKIPSFDLISEELAAKLRKYGNKQGTFPAFNMTPLYRLADAAIIKELNQIEKNSVPLDVEKIQSWCIDNNWVSVSRKIKLCIVGKATELETKIKEFFPDEENSLIALLEALKNFSEPRVASFRQALKERIFTQLQSGEDVHTALALLFHKGHSAKAPKDDRGSISVILDYAAWQEFDCPVASEHMTEWVNGVLWQTNARTPSLSGVVDADEVLDAFGLPLGNFEDKPMPEVNMPGLAGVKLRSMFNQVRCQKRYGCFDGASFPVSMKNRNNAKAALEYLSSTANKGVTWKIFGDKEIAFAYPSRLDQRASPLDWLAPVVPGAEDTENRERFELRAQDFIRSFNALPPKHKPDAIRIFSLRKMDKARTKVIFTRSILPSKYIDCAEKWQKGCMNIPELKDMEPITPFPVQVATLCNDVWKQNGELATTANSRLGRIQYYQGIELLLDTESAQDIVYFLNMLLQNCQGIFHFVGNTRHRNEKINVFVDRKLSMLVPLLGLLLYKGGHSKEIYMQSAGYLVGQLLKLSDELHAMYCRVVRGGSIPPQLVGNAVFVTASETPIKALALLGQRLQPYLAWAEQYSRQNAEGNQEAGKERWRAGWYLRLYGDFGGNLAEVLPKNTRFNEFEQAQVFLGYLAAFPKRQKTSNSEQNNPEESQDNE